MHRWFFAAFLLALGLFFYFGVYGFQFTGLLLCALSLIPAAYGVLDALKSRLPRASKYLRRTLTAVLALCALFAAATGIWIGSCAKGADDPDASYVIVLGAGVNGTAPSESLRERLTAAEAYLNAHPDATAVLSGGKGDRENISEAECMYRWLTARGIDPSRLRKEEQSVNTRENLRYSAALIEAESGKVPERVAIISSEYHLCRATLFAADVGMTALGYPAKTQNRPFFCNMLLREIPAVWAALLLG